MCHVYICGMTSQPLFGQSLALLDLIVEVLGDEATKEDAVLTTSFSMEDQVLTWAVLEAGLDIDLVSLDTGCLFPATLQTWKDTERFFGVEIRAIRPDSGALDSAGLSQIYASTEGRKACCNARKIMPLKAACAGKKWWLTGLRQAQSENRQSFQHIEEAPAWGLRKFHPLLEWDDAAVEALVSSSGVPVNPLYQLGYSSIGCAPCTRPVLPGEDARAGRWWWESSAKECGLHRS